MKHTHVIIPIKEIEARLIELDADDKLASMGESVGIMWERKALQALLKTGKKVNLSRKVTQQAACDFAGDRDQGGGHGYPSWTATCIEKGYNQAIKDLGIRKM